MATTAPNLPEFPEEAAGSRRQGGIQINFKRVADRAIRFWYLIVLSFLISVTIAYLINRYSTRMYPVKASIIIRENDENVGAKFLYNNELLTPYRNFYNELYIMKSYPLLEEVVVSLGFNVSYFREGEIKTSEYYDPHFPIDFKTLQGSGVYGQSYYLKVLDEQTFNLQHVSSEGEPGGAGSEVYAFNDSIKVNNAWFFLRKRGPLNDLMGKTFIVRINNPLTLAKQYSNRLKVNWATEGASVVDLEITGALVQKEEAFLKRFIERYQYYDVEKKNNIASLAIKFLDQQLVVIGDSLSHFEDQVEDFKHRNIITGLEEETNRLYLKLQELEMQKFQFKLMDNYFNYVNELLTKDQFEGIFTPASVGITDEVMAELINALLEEQAQVNLYKSHKSLGVERAEDNPIFKNKNQKIEYIKGEILHAIENTRATEKISIQFIDDQIKIIEDQLAKLPRTERELVAIQRNYSLRETLYVFLLQKRTEAGLSKASTTSDIVLVNPPMAYGAISPKTAQNYMLGIVLGLLLPIGIFVLLEVMNNRIQSKDDIEHFTSVPVVAGVGHNPATEQLIVHNKPRSAMAESFRSLRSNLNYFTGNQDHRIFMVTSSIPGEGKSFTTLNLASVYASAGKRTVIVGADLRKPKLFDELGLANTLGLSQYLSGMVEYPEIIQQSKVDNLSLIAGGPMPPNPSELLLRPRMEELINYLRTAFDYVIIDTPPMSYVTDAFVLSKYADHILFVVRQNYTPKNSLTTLDEYYVSGKITNISIVFNDVRKTGLGYGYGGYGQYGYGNYGYGYGYYGKRSKRGDGSGYYSEE